MATFSGADAGALQDLIDKHKDVTEKKLPPPAPQKGAEMAKLLPPAPGQVHIIRTEEELKRMQDTGQLVVTDWFAKWCKPCMNFKPTFKKLAKEYIHVLFCQIDTDENRPFTAKYKITAMPTFKVSCRSQRDWCTQFFSCC